MAHPAIATPDWLLKETFAVQHNPNCPMPFMVRLVGHRRGRLDMLPYSTAPAETKDALGFGKTVDEAASNALSMRGQQKAATAVNS